MVLNDVGFNILPVQDVCSSAEKNPSNNKKTRRQNGSILSDFKSTFMDRDEVDLSSPKEKRYREDSLPRDPTDDDNLDLEEEENMFIEASY